MYLFTLLYRGDRGSYLWFEIRTIHPVKVTQTMVDPFSKRFSYDDILSYISVIDPICQTNKQQKNMPRISSRTEIYKRRIYSCKSSVTEGNPILPFGLGKRNWFVKTPGLPYSKEYGLLVTPPSLCLLSSVGNGTEFRPDTVEIESTHPWKNKDLYNSFLWF